MDSTRDRALEPNVGRKVSARAAPEAKLHDLAVAGVIAWSGKRLRPAPPPARTRGPRTVADLLLEDRD